MHLKAIQIETLYVNLEKGIYQIDNENKEITIDLNLKAKKNKTLDSNTEIIFLVDNSTSMNDLLADNATTRKIKVNNSTETLIKNINGNNPNVKMSVLYFSDGISVLSDFTNNKDTLIQSIEKVKNNSASGNTNMGGALSKSKQRFSSDAKNKILILLTDGLPTDGASNTKAQLQDSNIYIISALVGLESANPSDIKEIFGTEQNPTADSFYNIGDNNIEATISNNIYNKILNNFEASITNINIKDYFPSEILENFEISIEGTSKGTSIIDNNIINWNIEDLKVSNGANLTYKLKLKENFNEAILDKILNTNQKVELNYNSVLGNVESNVMDDSPQISIGEQSENQNAGESKSKKITTSYANRQLPYTGKNITVLVSIMILTISSIYSVIKIKLLK